MTYDFPNFGRTRCQKTLVFVTLLSANLYAENQRKKGENHANRKFIVVRNCYDWHRICGNGQ